MAALSGDLLRRPTFLGHILTTSHVGIAVLRAVIDEQRTVDFTFTYVNPEIEKIVGRSSAAMTNPSASCLRLFPSAKMVGLFDACVRVLHTGQTYHEPEFAYTWDGINGWFDVQASRFEDSIVLMILDVTVMKQSQLVQQHQADELLLVNQELLRSNENLLEFSYVASHDLQEPLRKIRQFGEILSRQHTAQLGDEGLDLLRRMQTASVRMSTLIRDLLDYSRLTRQPDLFRQQTLNQIVDEVLTALELTVAEKRAIIEVGQLGNLAGDATQLAQLFQNLLTNALKFAKRDDPPHIRIDSQPMKRADLPPAFQPPGKQESFCAIRVADNGIGFDPGQAERIFGTFQRLHGKEYPGTGIGLAIAKKVAENHAGHIMAESQPNQGATFTVFLPGSHEDFS